MSIRRLLTPCALALCLLMAVAGAARSAGDDARTIKIAGTDAMKFSLQRIDARAGEKLKIVLTAQGAMPKSEMAHNWVLLARGSNVDAFVMSASLARKDSYLPPAKRSQVLAATALAGAGETVTVELQAPAEPGEYVYLCTFPGHYAGGMKGVLVVSK